MFSFFKSNNSVDVNTLDENLQSINLIDIREPYETNAGTIKGAKKVPMGKLLENPEKYLNKDDEYYIMCQSGMRSKRTTSSLIDMGYNVVNVAGGFGSYRGKNINR